MLTPDQVSQLRLQLDQEGMVGTFAGHCCTTLRLAPMPAHAACPVITRAKENVRMQAPANIIGVPYDPRCLAGIGNQVLEVPEVALYRVFDARIIGHQALIDANAFFYGPSPFVAGEDLDTVLTTQGDGHGGFVLHIQDDGLCATFVSREQPRSFEQSVLFLYNLEPGNYGSFIFRLLPQLMFAAEVGLEFDVYVTPERTPWFAEALHLAGLPERPVFTVGEVCGDQFRRVFFFTEMAVEGLFSQATRRDLARLASSALAAGASRRVARKLYVSRALSSAVRPWYRVLVNETQLEQLAEQAGFAVIYPETLALREQIRAFAGADQIVGPSGSGMLNAAFAKEDSRVLDMETVTTCVRQHAKIYSSTGKSYSFLFGNLAADDGSHPTMRSWTVPEQQFHLGIDWLAG